MIETRIRHAQEGIKRALDDFERYDKNTYGRRDAKAALPRHIDDLIAARIDAAMEALNERLGLSSRAT